MSLGGLILALVAFGVFAKISTCKIRLLPMTVYRRVMICTTYVLMPLGVFI